MFAGQEHTRRIVRWLIAVDMLRGSFRQLEAHSTFVMVRKVGCCLSDVVDDKDMKRFAQMFERFSVGDRGVQRECAGGFRVHSSIAKSEASCLIDQATESAKELMVEPLRRWSCVSVQPVYMMSLCHRREGVCSSCQQETLLHCSVLRFTGALKHPRFRGVSSV